MKIRKIFWAVAVFVFVFAGICQAAVNADYNSLSAEYGDRASAYIKQVPLKDGTVNQIHSKAINATVDTSTNIRIEPSAEVSVITTIESGTAVKIWGFTDNGWARIYYVTPDGTTIFGYIKSDLLFN